MSVALTACGGGDPAAPSGDDERAQPLATPGWTLIAIEGGSFVTEGAQTVRYGADTRWLSKRVSGSGRCTVDFFGADPAYGVAKTCELLGSGPSPVVWQRFAAEGHGFTLAGTQTLRYGVDTRWAQRSATSQGQCSSGFFGGDPAYGVVKACEGQRWSRVAGEGQAFSVAGTRIVRYGVDTRWIEKSVSGSASCSVAFFGGDPAYRTVKSCQLRQDLPRADNDTPPSARIDKPATGATFAAGETVVFAGTGSDTQDGPLAGSALSWWAELHHDTHTHPFQPLTLGGSGQVRIPTRGETSANIFYRFHLRVTDSTGTSTTVTRDLRPRTAQVTLASSPAGLALSLDGQPITAPHAFTGVVGIERDLGAPEQTANGRRWRFARWSDGGSASHTIATPAANTAYTATFTDLGPVDNNPPSVAMTTPANGSSGTTGTPITLSANASDSDGSIARVVFQADGATVGAADTSAPYSVAWTPATTGTHTLRAIATDDRGAATTSAAVIVTINAPTSDTQPPAATLSSPANLTGGLTGTLTLVATASDNVGVAGVEFQVDGVQVGATDASAPYQLNVDTTQYASGQHVVRARARDAAGNVSPWASATVGFAGSRAQPAGFTRNTAWITGLDNATAFAPAPDGRWFVAQQGGQLRVVKNGALLATPFLNVAVDDQGERGLIGVALHPDFATNRQLYVHYTTTSGGAHNRVSRFTASAGNPDVVEAGSELVLVELPALSGATNHNGGALHFGIDRKLYVAVGDNASGANAPLLTTRLGKLLRYNDDGTIPGDNPFYTSASGENRAIWARGLRNPFTIAVRASDGRIHVNDVGQDTWEEIDLGVPGANYGWPSTEGSTSAAGITAPLYAYDHDEGTSPGGFLSGCAIIGGSFYPAGGPFPAAYRDDYYFADYCSHFVARLDLVNGNVAYSFGRIDDAPVDLRAGSDGALYVLGRQTITRFGVP